MRVGVCRVLGVWDAVDHASLGISCSPGTMEFWESLDHIHNLKNKKVWQPEFNSQNPQWEERMGSCKLSSDLCMCHGTYILTYTHAPHIYAKNNNKRIYHQSPEKTQTKQKDINEQKKRKQTIWMPVYYEAWVGMLDHSSEVEQFPHTHKDLGFIPVTSTEKNANGQ